MEFKKDGIYFNGINISNWAIKDFYKVFMKENKNYVILADRENALWELYVNNNLVEIASFATKEEAKKRLQRIVDRMEERDYDVELAWMDLEWEMEF